MGSPVLEVRNINKYINETFSLKAISLDVLAGEVHAVIGENGSGKSTLMKIISGLIQPDSGEILLNGKNVTVQSVNMARKLGIHTVWQDINIYPNLTIAENVYADSLTGQHNIFKTINRYKIFDDCQKVFSSLNIRLDVTDLAGNLGFAERQLIEMVRAYVADARIIILDEPTAAFTEVEKKILFNMIEVLRNRKTAIFYITHHIEEIEQIADRLTVIHQGKLIATRQVKELDEDQIIKLLSVPAENNRYPKLAIQLGQVQLSVKGLYAANVLQDISFQLRKSEILGITGLMGSGRTLLAQCLFGITAVSQGEIEINGERKTFQSPDEAIEAGVALLPEDRLTNSIFSCLNLEDNVTMSSLKRFEHHKLLQNELKTSLTDAYIKKFNIRPGYLNDLAETYSGGNQQKAAFTRWIMSRAKIYILDEPTRGIDVGSRLDIYNCMMDLVMKGASIILISSDVEEILGMCDRMLVLSDGRITAEFKREEATKEKIMYKAAIKF